MDDPAEVARLIERRALPETEREEGDPFAPGLTDRQRAARLEGRKILTDQMFAGQQFESLYRVDCFRRFLPRNGMNGLVQFYGVRATRRWKVGSERKPKKWETDETPRLHTVDLPLKVK